MCVCVCLYMQATLAITYLLAIISRKGTYMYCVRSSFKILIQVHISRQCDVCVCVVDFSLILVQHISSSISPGRLTVIHTTRCSLRYINIYFCLQCHGATSILCYLYFRETHARVYTYKTKFLLLLFSKSLIIEYALLLCRIDTILRETDIYI